MSCPPEWTVGAYVDDGLALAEARRLEAHLVGCERCRGLVLALREEARALGEALREEAPAEPVAITVVAPARGAALALPVAIAATALVAAVASALYEMRLPAGIGWLHPSALLGVNEMLFDTLFLLRDRAPGWLELAAALGALAGLAAIATFLAGALMRRWLGTAALLVAAAAAGLAAGAPARALPRFAHEESVRIPAGESHLGTLVVSTESLEIDGVVVGDVIAFTERIAIRGEVDGSVFVFAREHELGGSVTGSLVAAGHQVRLEGAVGGSAYLAGERVSLLPASRVSRDAFLGGERVHVEGVVARDLAAGGERVELEGEVGRDLEAWTERLAILSGARVGGDLRAHLPDAERLEVAEGAVVAGVRDVEVLERRDRAVWSRYREGRFYTWLAVGFGASFLLGMLLYVLVPGLFSARLASGREFFVSLGLGFAFLVLGPIALVLVALTVVGIPLALIGLAAWAIALYLGAIVVAALIGRSLVRQRGERARDFGVALLVGLAVVVLLRSLPFVGRPAGWVIALVGVGLLVTQAYAAWRRRHAPGARASSAASSA
jgi:cytoskeletal protein CcmA (bactofilin family)